MAREKSRLTNKISLTALCIAMTSQLILVSTTYAEDVGTIFEALSNRANSVRAENARSAWARVSSSTTSCVQQHGISISAIVEAGVLPSDPRLKPIFAQCRAQLSGPSPESETGLRAPAIRSRQPKLIVGGLELGEIIDIQSEQFKPYHCTASKTFPNHIWCQRTVTGLGGESDFSATNMFLQSADGSVAYVSQAIKPAHFSPGDIEAEIALLSRRYGTPRVLKSTPGQTPTGVIAYWGSLNLTPLDSDATALIAAGHPSGKGLLFDFLNNFALSAQTGLDVYAPSEGRGYVWSASFDDSGTGVLRLTAIDSAAVGAPAGTEAVSSSAPDLMPFTSRPVPTPARAAAPPTPPDPSSMASEAAAAPSRNNVETGFGVLAHLTELPPACADVEKLGPESTWPQGWTRETRDPFSNRYSPSDTCKKVMECLPSFAARLNPIVDYLRPRPLLYAALKREAVTLPLMNLDLAIETLGYKIDQSVSDCSVSSLTLDRLMARSGADPGHSGVPAPFEYVQEAIRNLIADLRDKHNLEKSAYLEWTLYAKHYDRARELDAAERRYEQAFTGPDLEILLQAAQSLDEEMAKATAFQNVLAEQGKQLADLSERLAHLAARTTQEPLSKVVKPDEKAVISARKSEVDALASIPAPERGDVASQIVQLSQTADTLDNDLKSAQSKLDAMSQQGGKLADLSERLGDLAQQASQGPLATLVKANDESAIEKLKGDIDRLAQSPVPERGDVSGQIAQFEAAIAVFQSDISEAQAKADARADAKRQDYTRSASTAADNDNTGRAALELCKIKRQECLTLIYAIDEFVALSKLDDVSDKKEYCISKRSSAAEIVDSVRDYLAAHQETMTMSVMGAIRQALKGAYPCHFWNQ